MSDLRLDSGVTMTPMVEAKICLECRERLSLELFGFSGKKTPSGAPARLSTCKKCRNLKDRTFRATNPDRVRAYHRSYYQQQGHKRLAVRRIHYASDAEFREQCLEHNRIKNLPIEVVATRNQKAKENRASLSEDQRERLRANDRLRYHEKMCRQGEREKRLDMARATGRDKQKDFENSRKWRESNPLKFREYGHRRRARMAAAQVGKVSYDKILARDGMHCYLCNSGIADGDLSFDHVIPLIRGGAHSEDNVRTAHKSCNFRKNSRLLSEIRDPWLRLAG